MKVLVSISFVKSFLKSNPNKNLIFLFDLIKKQLFFDDFIKKDNILLETTEEKFYGVIIPELNIYIYYTQFLKFKKIKSRNTYIEQNIIPLIKKSLKNNFSIFISINPVDLNDKPIIPNYVIKSARIFKTIGINLTKSFNEIVGKIESFSSIEELYYATRKSNFKNKKNNPVFFEIDYQEKIISVFGKTDGANSSSTIILCMAINNLFDSSFEKTFFYLKSEKNIDEIINHFNFKINNENLSISNLKKYFSSFVENKITENQIKKIVKRNQNLFRKNIYEKYINFFDVNKCFASDYFINSNLIASHIHRFADIISDLKDKKISVEEATSLIVSGDNGFLLSPNKDKEFEKGMIFFDLESKTFSSNPKKLNIKENLYLEKHTQKILFDDSLLNENFISNVKKHLKRTQNE